MSLLQKSLPVISFLCAGFIALASEAKPLTLTEFLEAAKANDAEIQIILHKRTQTSFLAALQLPTPALVVHASNRYGFSLSSGKRTTFLNIGLSKLFPTTGTEVSVDFNYNDQVDRKEQVTTLSARQPLYRNQFGRQTKGLASKLDMEAAIIHLESVEALEDYVATIVFQYLDWQLAALNLRTARQQQADSVKLKETIEQRRARGVATGLDVDRVTLEALTRQQTVQERESTLADQAVAIGRVVGKTGNTGLTPDPKPQSFELDTQGVEISKVLASARTTRALRLSGEAGTLNILILREDLDPSLNFVAGLRDDRSTRFGTDVDQQEAFVGLELEWPLMDRQRKALLRQAIYERTTVTLALKQFQENLAASMRAQLSKLEKLEQQLQTSRLRQQTATRVVEVEILRK